MQFRAHNGPLADCGADPLDRSGPHIAASEYVANAGFQRQRTAGSIIRPPGIRWNVRSWQNEVLGVQGDSAIPEPAVAGPAPMKQKTWRIGFSVSSPVTLLRQRTRSSCFSRLPYRATISVWVNTSILSIARMRSMRYC